MDNGKRGRLSNPFLSPGSDRVPREVSRRNLAKSLIGGIALLAGVTSIQSVSADTYSDCVSKCAGIGGRYCTPHTIRCFCDSIGQTYCYCNCYNDYAKAGCDPYNSTVYNSQIHCRST